MEKHLRFAILLIFSFGFYLQVSAQQFERIYANDAQTSQDKYLLLIKAGYVENQSLAVDKNTSSRATLYSTSVNVAGIILGGSAVLRVRFTGTDKPTPGVPVSIKLGVGGNVLSALNAITIQAINGTGNNQGQGNEVGPVYSGTQVVSLLSGKNQIEFTITPQQAYDGVKISLGIPQGVLNAGVLTSLEVHEAYFLKPASSIICGTIIDSLYGSTGTLLGGLNTVSAPSYAFDQNENTYATLRTNVSAVNSTFLTGIYSSKSKVGDTIRLLLQNENTGLLDATLLSSLRVRTFDGSTERQNFTLNSSLLSVQLLGGSNNQYSVSISTSASFDRVQISIGDGLVNALAGVRIYEMKRMAQTPLIENSSISGNQLNTCFGTATSFTILSPEAGANYRWFNAPQEGSEITTGVSNNGASFSPTGLTPGTYSYYVALYRNGCADAVSDRAKVTITVNPLPSVNIDSPSACIEHGDVVFTLSNKQNAPISYQIQWTQAALDAGFPNISTDTTIPANNHISFAIPANIEATDYSGSIIVKNGNGCVSTAKNIQLTISPAPEAPHIDINSTASY